MLKDSIKRRTTFHMKLKLSQRKKARPVAVFVEMLNSHNPLLYFLDKILGDKQ